MFDPHDPRASQWEAERPYRESLYLGWCNRNQVDPEDTQSMIDYEKWTLGFQGEAAQQHWPELAS